MHPLERLLELPGGSSGLSDAELLAILTGAAPEAVAALRLAEAGRFIGIPLLDHLIVAREGFTSLAQITDLPGIGGSRTLLTS